MESYITIIVPVYDEQESLPSLFSKMDIFLQQAPCNAEVLLVNDGSTDNSLQMIRTKCEEADTYSYISFDKNYGLSSAIKAGIDNCSTPLVGYIDADLQTDPMDFISYLPYFPEFDMVNGIREKRQDSIIKILSSKLANRYRRIMIGDGVQDTCCPLKIMKIEYASRVPFYSGMHRFLPALVQLLGGKVHQLPVSLHE